MTIADRQTGDPFFYLERQALSALLGGVLATVLLFVPMATWERLSPTLMLGAFALLIVVLIPGLGHEVNGSRRWIRLAAFNFQPSEAARVMLLIYVSGYAVRRSAELRTTLGDVYDSIYQSHKAAEMHRRALALNRQLYGKMSTNVADSLEKLGMAIEEQGEERERLWAKVRKDGWARP